MTAKILPFLGAMIMLLSITSCGPTLRPFTQDLYADNDWSDTELKNIQFYLSRDIVLRRQASGGSSQIVDGEIKVVEGQKVEEVVLKAGTPGVFLFSPKKDRFAVGFDANSDNYLVFGPNPNAGDRYVLLASEWNRRQGEVTYAGKKWRVSSDAAWAALMVDLKKIKEVSVTRNSPSGRTVN